MVINLTHLKINRNTKPEGGTSRLENEEEIPLRSFGFGPSDLVSWI